jgi:hypothetical protein
MQDQIVVPFARMEEAFDHDPARYQKALDQLASEAANGDSVLKAQYLASWNTAINSLRKEDTGSAVMASAQNDLASRIQTSLVDFAKAGKHLSLLRAAPDTAAAKSLRAGSLFEVKFDKDDWWGWLSIAWKLVHPPAKSPWIAPSEAPETFLDDAVIAVFSDWGTGLYGAPYIANSVASLIRCDVCLHMGDTYYSGSDQEIRERLLHFWPRVSTKTASRTLNGNHEMYSGGKGYFQVLASAPFNQSASCFAMQNTNWLLLCLDTSYVDFALDDAQVDWIKRRIAAAGKRKVILFSHHQPFSHFSNVGEKIWSGLSDVLEAGRIYAWFFGHEHRLVLYEPHATWGLKARCMGNGGFPELRDTVSGCGGPDTRLVPLAHNNFAPAARLLDGPNPFIKDHPSDPPKYIPHGFLTLQFNGPSVMEAYLDPNGKPYQAATPL